VTAGSGALLGRVIAVAGAAGGLGPAVLRRLAADGATIAATDVDQGKLDALAGELGLAEDRLDTRVVDLLDPDAAAQWAAAVAGRFGAVHGVAHLVGGWRGGTSIEDGNADDWPLLHDLLVRTVQNTTGAFAPHLRSAGEWGRFVLVSAKGAQRPTKGNASYAAAKAAAEAWTLTFATELAEAGATANIVVVTAIGDAKPSFTPPEELAAAIAWLCSDAAAKMNGQRLSLHG
jgi:NAD(P)-dependent dehydrogenase (short-subunit alcohol dehydrogenase family)